jgi:GntR family transcriptional regulator, negative regulator for fad regulon and positive regulator of fabA
MYQRIPPKKPAAYAEQALVTDILNGTFPPGSLLPAERELSVLLGVTRPTLREALRRIESDGWVSVQQGKPTQVMDYWRDGGLNLLSSLVRNSQQIPNNFIPNLLEVRLDMAPSYTRSAVENSPAELIAYLDRSKSLDESPEKYASYDWELHKALTVWSNNPIYSMILNGFTGFYEKMGTIYFHLNAARVSSRNFYQALQKAARDGEADEAQAITRKVMRDSISLWEKAYKETGGGR